MLPEKFFFANAPFLVLLALLPIIILWFLAKYRQQYPELKMSTLAAFAGANSWKGKLRPILTILKVAAIGLLIFALARPQNKFDEEEVKAEGIDIVLVMDVSGSMKAQDFEPDRLGASKEVAKEFVDSRPHDRIGLVVFAGESFTQCPVTTDKNILQTLLAQIQNGLIEDGTAIGMGLATAVNRLRESESKSKIVVLLTDGVNNQGFIDPMTAAETAKSYGIKVYTIGVGTKGKAPYPVRSLFGRLQYQMMEVQIDEELLEKIANMTGGKYFRATDNNSLRKIYSDIDTLEKTEIEVTKISRFTEQFHWFAILALCCLGLDWMLRNTLFRGIT